MKATLQALLLIALAGCGRVSGAPEPVPLPTREAPPSDGLLDSSELQLVVNLQVLRDGPGLIDLLESPDPAVRARAALALASVQDPDGLEPLEDLLTDSDSRVRGNAAFALGQIPLADGGERLLEVLRSETDPAVRASLIEAIGKRGTVEVIVELAGMEPDPATEAARLLALAAGGARRMENREIMEVPARSLIHEDPEVRMAASYMFSHHPSAGAWLPWAEEVRSALDRYPPDEPAAMNLLPALVRIRNIREDRERMLHWLATAEDWRVRASVAVALRDPGWADDDATREALFDALDDSSDHVSVAAAVALGISLWGSGDVARTAQLLNGREADWREQAQLVAQLVPNDYDELVVNWTRRMAATHPLAARAGIIALAPTLTLEARQILFEMARSDDPYVRAAAFDALGSRAGRDGDRSVFDGTYDLLVGGLASDELLPMARAAAGLSRPDFEPYEPHLLIEAEYEARRSTGDPAVLIPLIRAMAAPSLPFLWEILEDPDYRLRRAAAAQIERVGGEVVSAEEVGVPRPERPIDWAALAALGPEPRVRLETDRGEIVLRLLSEQAPATVQAFVELVRSGRYDGTAFHRVVPNFVVQGGDIGVGDGSGGPGYQLPTEITQLPFDRGVLGMASSGKDTEGSQFYLIQSLQAHLNGGYTAFGWMESGAGALDLLQEGDRILRATVLP